MISLFKKSKMAIPSGVILAWYGIIADIPAGWVLCNGANDTPDLRQRFIRGALVDADLGDAIGVDYHSHRMDFGNHNHSFDDGGHFHGIGSGGNIAAGSGYADATTNRTASGTTGNKDLDGYTGNEDNIPRSRKLFWIMKA